MINISKLKNENDLKILAEAYSNYYASSVLDEKWTKETATKMFRYFYDKEPDLIFVAYDKDKPVGIIMTLLKPWWDGNHLEDGELFVCEEYRKQGIAKQLLKTLCLYAI